MTWNFKTDRFPEINRACGIHEERGYVGERLGDEP